MMQENIFNIMPPITALINTLGLSLDKLLRCMKKLPKWIIKKNKLAASSTSVSKPLLVSHSLRKSILDDASMKMANTGYSLVELFFKFVVLLSGIFSQNIISIKNYQNTPEFTRALVRAFVAPSLIHAFVALLHSCIRPPRRIPHSWQHHLSWAPAFLFYLSASGNSGKSKEVVSILICSPFNTLEILSMYLV